jgi:hypothetical protein
MGKPDLPDGGLGRQDDRPAKCDKTNDEYGMENAFLHDKQFIDSNSALNNSS